MEIATDGSQSQIDCLLPIIKQHCGVVPAQQHGSEVKPMAAEWGNSWNIVRSLIGRRTRWHSAKLIDLLFEHSGLVLGAMNYHSLTLLAEAYHRRSLICTDDEDLNSEMTLSADW